MSLSQQQLADIEHLKDLYEQATQQKDGQTAIAIVNRLRGMGFVREAKTLLNNTRIMDLVTPSCKSTWETDNPTQETINK